MQPYHSKLAGPDTPRVLAAASRLIQEARQTVPWYAGPFAPIRTDQVADLLRAHRCILYLSDNLNGDTAGMALPRMAGLCPIVIARETPRTERMLIARHELAHAIAGELDEPTYLTADDATSFSERVADLFALADLIPAWLLQDLRRSRMKWDDVLLEIRHGVWDSAQDWPEDRIGDRAELRLRFFREFGL